MAICSQRYVWKRSKLLNGKFVDSNCKADPLKQRLFFGENDYIRAPRKNIKSNTYAKCCEGWRAVSLIEVGRRAKVRRGENQRRRDSLEIPKSLPKCDHCIFYRARGIANGFLRSSLHREPACILSPGRCRRYTCRSRFSFLFATQRAFQRGLKSSDSAHLFVIYFPVKNSLKLSFKNFTF